MRKYIDTPLVFIDIECTGLDREVHEIIEMAAIVYDPTEDKIIKQWEKKIAPSHIETATPIALEINGYKNNPGLYTGNLKSALIKFNTIVKKRMIVGQNIAEFDLPFISTNMKKFNIEPAWDRHRKLELMSMAWPAIRNSEIKGLSLSKLCDHFDISNVGEHTALVDCIRAFEVYKCLMNIYDKTI